MRRKITAERTFKSCIMKKIISILIIATFLTSCFSKNHKLDKIAVSGLIQNEGGYPYATISYCLKEKVGYSTYIIDFDIVTKNNHRFHGQDEIIGGNDIEKQCFEFHTTSVFNGLVSRGDSAERYKEVAEIYKENIESMEFSIHEQNKSEVLDKVEIRY